MQYLPKADHIISMKDGRIAEMGSFEQLMAANGDFRKLFDVRTLLDMIGKSREE